MLLGVAGSPAAPSDVASQGSLRPVAIGEQSDRQLGAALVSDYPKISKGLRLVG